MDQRVCQAKIGPPYGMHECGEPVEYLTAEAARAEGFLYSGWYHIDRDITADHHAVWGI